MSKKHEIFPRGFNAFNAYILLVFAYLKANMTRLKISDDQITALQKLIFENDESWTFLFNIHSTSATKLSPATKKLQKLMKDIIKVLQAIYSDILRSIMTIDDFQTLNIAEPNKPKSPRKPIKDSPIVKLITKAGAIIDFIVRWNTDSKRASMHPDADVIRVVGKIVKPGEALPTTPEECTITFTSKKALFNHKFSIGDAGSCFACFVQYANESDEGKSGPYSTIQVIIIGM